MCAIIGEFYFQQGFFLGACGGEEACGDVAAEVAAAVYLALQGGSAVRHQGVGYRDIVAVALMEGFADAVLGGEERVSVIGYPYRYAVHAAAGGMEIYG